MLVCEPHSRVRLQSDLISTLLSALLCLAQSTRVCGRGRRASSTSTSISITIETRRVRSLARRHVRTAANAARRPPRIASCAHSSRWRTKRSEGSARPLPLSGAGALPCPPFPLPFALHSLANIYSMYGGVLLGCVLVNPQSIVTRRRTKYVLNPSK